MNNEPLLRTRLNLSAFGEAGPHLRNGTAMRARYLGYHPDVDHHVRPTAEKLEVTGLRPSTRIIVCLKEQLVITGFQEDDLGGRRPPGFICPASHFGLDDGTATWRHAVASHDLERHLTGALILVPPEADSLTVVLVEWVVTANPYTHRQRLTHFRFERPQSHSGSPAHFWAVRIQFHPRRAVLPGLL